MTTPASSETSMITGLFNDRAGAERAYRAARDLGYEPKEINVLLSEETRERYFSHGPETQLSDKASQSTEESTHVADELGGPPGGTIGTIAPALAAVGTLLLVPGLGLLAAGPIAVALTAAGAVGVTGGLIGALTNWGVPKGRVEQYESGIRNGGILFAVKPASPSDADELARRWQAIGGANVHS
jgi:hypothetical protein